MRPACCRDMQFAVSALEPLPSAKVGSMCALGLPKRTQAHHCRACCLGGGCDRHIILQGRHLEGLC